MSDFDYDSCEDELEMSSLDFSDDDDYVNDINQEESNIRIMYTFPTSVTSGGFPTHRMKYLNLSIDDIQLELQSKIQSLSAMLHLDYGKCLILLLLYSWNEDKLLDEYVNSENQKLFLKKRGIISRPIAKLLDDLITTETDPEVLCGICYCGPTDTETMDFFRLDGCNHKFCVDCYIQYINGKNEESRMFIECPFSDPKCNLIMTTCELKVISDYHEKQQSSSVHKPLTKLPTNIISEKEIKGMYNLSSDKDDSGYDSEGNPIEHTDDTRQDSPDEEAKLNQLIYDFQTQLRKKEKQEHDAKYNKTILSKYWYNVGNQYCSTHPKKYKHCPYPDCDGVVQFVGFDSDHVANIEEHNELLLIPLVRCSNRHQFCFGCDTESHSPCPCKVVARWNEKSQDDSETVKWMTQNTKDCPKCKAVIEKNGGCNHMTCRNCAYEFCWPCLGDWMNHSNNYRCDKYVEKPRSDGNKLRESLERYAFYCSQFNNQRVSHEKDRALLSQFEMKIRQLSIGSGASWIETAFYKECINSLLECRQCLKWSYAFLFFVPQCRGKQLIETGQWQLSNKIEQLSRLFGDVPISEIFNKKNSFIKFKSSMIEAQEKFLETCIDIFSDKNTLNNFKDRLV